MLVLDIFLLLIFDDQPIELDEDGVMLPPKRENMIIGKCFKKKGHKIGDQSELS